MSAEHEPQPAPAAPRRRRRWPWVLGALIALVPVLLGIVLLLLATAADRAVVIRNLLEVVDSKIAGRIELQQAWLFPNGHLIAHDVTLRDPHGGVIIHAATVDTHVDLRELTKLHLHLTQTELTGGSLFLATHDQEGLNIAAAFAPKHPAPVVSPPPDGGASAFTFDIDAAVLQIDQAQFALGVADGPAAASASPATTLFNLQGAVLHASASMDAAGALYVDAPSLQAQAVAPLPGPLQLEATVRLAASQLQVKTEASLDALQVQGQLDLNVSTLDGHATLSRIAAGPHALDQWLSTLEPQALQGNAEVALHRRTIELQSLEVAPVKGEGTLNASARLDLVNGDGTAKVIAHDLNTRTLLGRLPRTTLAMELDAHVTNLLQSTRQVTAHLTVGSSVIEGQHAGPGIVDARVGGDGFTLTGVDVAFPGGRVKGEGTIVGSKVDAQAHIDAPNLASLRAALEGMLSVNLPDFTGSLASDVTIRGPLSDPAITATVQAPHISLNGLEADQVEAQLDASRLGRSMDLTGKVTMAQFVLADHVLQGVGLTIAWTTPDLHLEVQAQESGKPISIVSDLEVPPSLDSANLTALALHIAGSDWRLWRPAKLEFREGVTFDQLELRSDPQRLAVSLAVTPHGLRTTVRVEALDLARLPAALLPSLGLAGQVEGTAHYEEAAGKRTGGADLRLSQIDVRGLVIPSGHVQGSLNQLQMTANVVAKLAHGEIVVTGSAPLPPGSGSVAAKIAATGILLDDFAGLAPRLAAYHGTVSVLGNLSGTWAAPQVVLTASGDGVTGPWTTEPQAGVLINPLNLTVDLTLNPAGVKDDIHVRAGQALLLSSSGTAEVSSRRVFDELAHPSQLKALVLNAELTQDLTLQDVPLQPVAHLVALSSDVQGTLSATGSFRGSAHRPRGQLTLHGTQLEYRKRPLGGLELRLTANESRFEGHADLRPPHGALTATAEWLLAPEKLLHASDRLAAKLTADVQVVGLPLATALGNDASLQGLAELSASFQGTLASPSAQAKVSLHDLHVRAVPIGRVDAEGSWAGKRLIATLTGKQPQGGHLEGHADVPLMLQGDASAEPLTASLIAQGFDLAPFSALASQDGLLRAIGGRLDSNVTVGGTLSAPVPQGTIGLSAGKLALAGFGQFDDLIAQISFDANGAEIQRVMGKSAGGTFLVQGSVHRNPAAGLAVQTQIGTKGLGIYQSDRLLGYLSSKEDLTGNVTQDGTELNLAVHRALFTLPELVPKTTAPTSLDSDIVLSTDAPLGTKSYPIRITVDAPNDLEVKAIDLDIKARAAMVLLIQGGAQAKGGVYATSGEVNAYGRRFEIEHANVTFGRGEEFGLAGDPTLDARATERIAPYRLFIDVTGRVSDLKIATSSDPPLNREKVGLLLITGSTDGLNEAPGAGASQGGGLVAASALGGLLSEKLRSSLGPYMPLDVLTVEPVHIEAGKHITPQLYVGAVENLGVTDPRINGAEIHANYKLSEHWSVDSKYGTAQAGNLDLQWTRNW